MSFACMLLRSSVQLVLKGSMEWSLALAGRAFWYNQRLSDAVQQRFCGVCAHLHVLPPLSLSVGAEYGISRVIKDGTSTRTASAMGRGISVHAALLGGDTGRLCVQVNAAWGQACLLLDALVCSL